MTIYSISELNLLKFNLGENTECYGCKQEWYHNERQREAGCGPTTACNILLYLTNLGIIGDAKQTSKREALLELMEDAWNHITPTENGIATTKMFCTHLKCYGILKGISMTCKSIDIPEDVNLRPSFEVVRDFIIEALEKNVPVAFLNLCNGDVCNLNKWHWVTIAELQQDQDMTRIKIIDEGTVLEIDFALWYSTTTRGGGLVYIFPLNQES